MISCYYIFFSFGLCENLRPDSAAPRTSRGCVSTSPPLARSRIGCGSSARESHTYLPRVLALGACVHCKVVLLY